MLSLFTNKYVIGVIAGLAILAGVWYYGNTQYNSGYHVADLERIAQIEQIKSDAALKLNEEVQRQIAANDEAAKQAATQIAQMQTENESLARQLEQNNEEAETDINSQRIGLDLPSVMRLNKIK